jgi:uncharacterized protein
MAQPKPATPAIRAAKPTLRVDGQKHDLAQRLLDEMVVREQEGGLATLELGFVDWSGRENGRAALAFENERLFALGSEIRIGGGAIDDPTEIFVGRISAMALSADGQGAPRLTIHAEDSLARARLMRRIEVYEGKSVADIARDIAARLGLKPVVKGLGNTTGTWVQANESDLAFLRRLLARHDADVQVFRNELHVAPRAQGCRTGIELALRAHLRRVRVVADLSQQVTDVRVTGFDPRSGKAVQGSGSGAVLGPGTGRTGAALLRRASIERNEQTSHRLALSAGEARALAEAEFAARARSFVRVEGAADGDPQIRVGAQVTLRAVSPRFDNIYYVTACTHRFDDSNGYETCFTAESAYLGNPS